MAEEQEAGTPGDRGARGARGDRGAPSERGTPIARRTMLGTFAAGIAGLVAAPYLQRGWEGVLSSASQHDPTGLTGLLPDPGGFRYYSVTGSVPTKDDATYALTIDGLVERPRTWTLPELRALPQTRLVRDVLCTDGWRVDRTPFEGVRLADLLKAAGVRPRGTALRFTCFDGAYSENLTLEQANRPDMLVALRMQDKPISHAHGGPVRLYAAPMYFYKSAKWLSGVTVTDHVIPGYWEQRGYDIDGWLEAGDRTDDAA